MSSVATQGQALDRPPGSGSEPCWIPSANSLTEGVVVAQRANPLQAVSPSSQTLSGTSVLRVSLPKRLGRYGLTLHADKTRVLPFWATALDGNRRAPKTPNAAPLRRRITKTRRRHTFVAHTTG